MQGGSDYISSSGSITFAAGEISKVITITILGVSIKTIAQDLGSTPETIAWVLTENESGTYNLAPFSYFNGICSDPPVVMKVGYSMPPAREAYRGGWTTVSEG